MFLFVLSIITMTIPLYRQHALPWEYVPVLPDAVELSIFLSN